jgi:hypothetical protein
MLAFDYWVGQGAHYHPDHMLLWRAKENQADIGITFLDYGDSMGWCADNSAGRPWDGDSLIALKVLGASEEGIEKAIRAIKQLDEGVVAGIVERIPASYLSGSAKEAILVGLLKRRGFLGTSADLVRATRFA